MSSNTIELTKESGLCCSCGICKGVCPKSCIEYKKTDGMYYPVINSTQCINCGICYDVCPGVSHDYKYADAVKAVIGDNFCSVNAFSKNDSLRHVSASGGCVSTLIAQLIGKNVYDAATTVNTYHYREQIKSTLITADSVSLNYSETSYPKSRYLPVSHEDIIRYILNNRDKKIVFIGTSCAIRGFLSVVDKFKLNRDNYLLIGLFCDKIFNYNIYDYYCTFADGKELTALHFKNKDSGGWPGNMKLMFSDGTYKYLNSSERAKMKEFFMPERCLYCVDKLNVQADISIGDNFTDYYSSNKGSNSVIIRTQRGLDAWNSVADSISSENVDIDIIAQAQGIDARLKNAYFARIKQGLVKNKYSDLNLNATLNLTDNVADYYRAYCKCMEKIKLGKKYNAKPERLKKYLEKEGKNGVLVRVIALVNRVYHKILRITYLRVLFK